MKKYLFTILLLLMTCTSAHASVEGRMFLKIEYKENQIIIPLHKVFEKNIQAENIKEGLLYLDTPEKENDFFDITHILKTKIENEQNYLTLNMPFDFCKQNCKADKYPYVKIHYTFNKKPTILLKSPGNNASVTTETIVLEWEAKDSDGKFLEYIVEVSKDDFFEENIVFQSDWFRQNQYEIPLEQGLYYWRVFVRDNSYLQNTVISKTFSFEKPPEQTTETEQTTPENEVTKREDPHHDSILPVDEEILGIGGASHNMPSIKIPNPSLCRYKYNRTQRKFVSRRCNITKPVINRIANTTKDNKTFNTTILGVYNPNFVVLIDEYQCTFRIFCREKFVKTTRLNLTPHTKMMVYINNTFTNMNNFRIANKYFFTSLIVSNNNLAGRRANLRYSISQAFRFDGHWVDLVFTSPISDTKTVPNVTVLPTTSTRKIFRFPFNKNIGVTQWHGYTAFQSPHTGIDFGSYKEPLYAIADGTIREATWDNYSGKCLTGGHFVRVEHTNGMNSVYLHLEDYKKNNGVNWKVGESIRKGELIGRTGNSGYYNCQPLGYHLHFELRRDSRQANHLNPVPYIDVNWDNIHTIQHTKYPGRLTGNNPHPTY